MTRKKFWALYILNSWALMLFSGASWVCDKKRQDIASGKREGSFKEQEEAEFYSAIYGCTAFGIFLALIALVAKKPN